MTLIPSGTINGTLITLVGGVTASVFCQQINENFESLRQQNNTNMAYLYFLGITTSPSDHVINADLIQFPNSTIVTASDLNTNFKRFQFSEVNQWGKSIPFDIAIFYAGTKLNPDDLNQNFSRLSKIINQQSLEILAHFPSNNQPNINIPITAIMSYNTSLGGTTAAFYMTGLTEPVVAGNENGRGLVSWGDNDTISWDILDNGANTHTYTNLSNGIAVVLVTSQNQQIDVADFRLIPSGKVAGNASGWTQISLQNAMNRNINAFYIGSSFMDVDIKNSNLISFKCMTPHNMTDMSNKFANCSSLLSVTYPSTQDILASQNMFYNCSSIQSIPMNDITSNCTNFASTFEGCSSASYVEWKTDSEKTARALAMNRMYYGCTHFLQNRHQNNQIDINVNSCIDCTDMYNGCTSMLHARVDDFSFFTLDSARALTRMFYNCTHMIDFKPNGGYDFGLITGGTLYSDITFDLTDMFHGCAALTDGVLNGTQSNISYINCVLNESALVDIFNKLSVLDVV